MMSLKNHLLIIGLALSLILILSGHGLAAGCTAAENSQGEQQCTLADGTLVVVETQNESGNTWDVRKIDATNSTILNSGSQAEVQNWLDSNGATAGFNTTPSSGSSSASAATAGNQSSSSACSKNSFFFLPPWYEYLKLDPGTCTPQVSSFSDIYPIGLAVLEMLLRLAGFAAVISIIISGITYITATGNAEKAASARRRLYNSLIGLAIAFVAAGVVAFIGNSII